MRAYLHQLRLVRTKRRLRPPHIPPDIGTAPVALVVILIDAHVRGTAVAGPMLVGGLLYTLLIVVVLRLVLGSWWEAALAGLVGYAFTLGLIVTVTVVLRIGLATLTVSIFRSLAEARRATMEAAGRAAPITLAVLFVAFLSDEAWKVLAAMSLPRYVGLVVAVLVIASAAAAGAAYSERELLKRAEPKEAGRKRTRRVPARRRKEPEYKKELEEAFARCQAEPAQLKQLSLLQKVNVALAFTSTILARVLAVWVLVGAAFTLIGVIAVDDDVASALLGKDAAAGGLSWTLVGLAFLLGAVASLTFAAGALAVDEQRLELVEDQAERLRERLHAWQRYEVLRRRSATGADSAVEGAGQARERLLPTPSIR